MSLALLGWVRWRHTCLISLFLHNVIPGLALKFPVYLGQVQVCGCGPSWGQVKLQAFAFQLSLDEGCLRLSDAWDSVLVPCLGQVHLWL